VETWPLAKTDESRARLLSVIQHDVSRLDRLITDISDASRLDAELARSDAKPFELPRLIEAVVEITNSIKSGEQVTTVFTAAEHPLGSAAYQVIGHVSRIGQVINNLIDNAKSFSRPEGQVRVFLARLENKIEIRVEDDGPGIPIHALEKIFERFYTDRPNHGFGQNSGLGLSISRQIIAAHLGSIWAENRFSDDKTHSNVPIGACFIIQLPAANV
jgi:two-component system sensor histidine kinase ChvG